MLCNLKKNYAQNRDASYYWQFCKFIYEGSGKEVMGGALKYRSKVQINRIILIRKATVKREGVLLLVITEVDFGKLG